MNLSTLCHALLAALALAPPARPGPTVDLADGISAREAVALALERSPQLLSLRWKREAAQAGVADARAFADPELRTGRFDFDEEGSLVRNYSLALRWTPPRLGERGLKGSWALGKVSETDAEIEGARQQLAAEIRLLHMNIVFLDKQIKLAEDSLKVREQIAEFVEAQVAAGVKTALDQNVAELALADARTLPGMYSAERRLAMSRLAAELGFPRSRNLVLQLDEDPLALQPRSFEPAGEAANPVASRGEFAMQSARCSQAEALLKLKRRERYPWLSHVQLTREFGAAHGADTWGFRLGLELPVFKWLRGTTRAPAAELERCRAELDAVRSRIGEEVEELQERLRARYGELQYQRQTIEPLARRDLELSEAALAAGQGDRALRLASEARRLARQQTYLAKLHEYRRLEIELDRALGHAIPR